MARARTGVRVIAGSAKGRRLDTPPGLGTRPITDRVKESLFGTLTPFLPDADVLDLYAGSGAMAIEALSRGAASAVLVERDPAVAELIEGNLTTVGFAASAKVVCADVLQHLRRAVPARFDLVFLDPPYDAPDEDVADAVALLVTREWLADEPRVVIRRRAGAAPPVLPEGLEFTRVREYGDTVVLIAAGP